DMDVRLRHEDVAIDADARTVTARDLHSGTDVDEPFDQLVIATGATPSRPSLPGSDAEGVHVIQTLADGLALRSHLEMHPEKHKRAVVIGCGYVGLDMAEAMRRRGLEVTVVDGHSHPMTTAVDADIGGLV